MSTYSIPKNLMAPGTEEYHPVISAQFSHLFFIGSHRIETNIVKGDIWMKMRIMVDGRIQANSTTAPLVGESNVKGWILV
jgi:hypothetical protein